MAKTPKKQPTRASIDDFRTFLGDPQGEGVWSMRVELSDAQTSSLARFLNIESYMLRGGRGGYYSYFGKIPYGYNDRPAVLMPKLFSYLRASIPQKDRVGLPGLTLQEDARPSSPAGLMRRRGYGFIQQFSTPPSRVSSAKQHILGKAVRIYRQEFLRSQIKPVPEDFSKIDVPCREPLGYFQVAEELPVLRMSSPCETTLHNLRDILETVIKGKLETELTKVFSPESTLMGMYLPMLQLVPLSSVLKDRSSIRNLQQALSEAREERFVHAVRAIGIAAEELLVEIYETYLREKAPEAPLGSIIQDLSGRIQEVIHGAKATKNNSLGAVRKQVGKAIEKEKASINSESFLLLAEQLQKAIIPILEDLRLSFDEHPYLNIKTQKVNLFPLRVQRCLSELIILRNRVSHRVERVVSVASVGYIDTAVALRDFVVIAHWWESERKRIDYKSTRKVMIQETVKRSQERNSEAEAGSH
jgi:hypothetical protein